MMQHKVVRQIVNVETTPMKLISNPLKFYSNSIVFDSAATLFGEVGVV